MLSACASASLVVPVPSRFPKALTVEDADPAVAITHEAGPKPAQRERSGSVQLGEPGRIGLAAGDALERDG